MQSGLTKGVFHCVMLPLHRVCEGCLAPTVAKLKINSAADQVLDRVEVPSCCR